MVAPVLIAALNYACLALVDICTRAVQPTFFSTPIELGGLGLPPHHIGKILSLYGILNGILQIFFFAKTQARFGAKNVYVAGIASSLLVIVTFPVINALARAGGGNDWLLWFAVACQIVSSIFINFSYGKLTHSRRVYIADVTCSFRLHIHVHHRLRTEPGIPWFSQWTCTAQRIYNARSRSSRSQLAVLLIN